MKRIPLVFLSLAPILAGCVDTPDSVSREYRNVNNEVIDSLMMTTNDATAERMLRRIIKPSKDRYDAIDKKLASVEQNSDRKDFVKAVFESNGVHLYLTELDVNRQRFVLEMARLRKLYKELADAGEECPALKELVADESTLDHVRKQLTDPNLLKTMKNFKKWKLSEYPELLEKFMERRKVFQLKEKLDLVN
ncbi:MAG: hypothetical protein HYX68_09515 [Planctomycetes bacterium]|nr:hypothetical protein [Planctomycetota bacterium]